MPDEQGLTDAEIAAEGASALPDKEVVSILDLNADLDLAIDAAAPIDLAVAANANVAAPIDAAVGANVLSEGSTAQALSDQGVLIDQNITADATANATQDSTLEQGTADSGLEGEAVAPAATTDAPTEGTADLAGTTLDPVGGTTGGALGGTGDTIGLPDTDEQLPNLADGNLLNVNVDLNGDVGVAAPINGAVAANANVAAPIDAAVAANIGSVDSDAVAIAQQDAIINQNIEGSADANADQASEINQP